METFSKGLDLTEQEFDIVNDRISLQIKENYATKICQTDKGYWLQIVVGYEQYFTNQEMNSAVAFISKNIYTPPIPSTLRVAIPEYWEMLFPNDRFVVGGFDIALERTDKNVLCVDVAYLDWRAFQDELDKPENAALKRHMEVVWDYLKNEIEQHNFV
jgi:hypothetical protein